MNSDTNKQILKWARAKWGDDITDVRISDDPYIVWEYH